MEACWIDIFRNTYTWSWLIACVF